jgi:hypothetical protein
MEEQLVQQKMRVVSFTRSCGEYMIYLTATSRRVTFVCTGPPAHRPHRRPWTLSRRTRPVPPAGSSHRPRWPRLQSHTSLYSKYLVSFLNMLLISVFSLVKRWTIFSRFQHYLKESDIWFKEVVWLDTQAYVARYVGLGGQIFGPV